MKKPALRCALFMALYYGANAVYQGYISKFYQQSGISGSRLILLLVSFPLLSILSQPLWGWASDRMPRRNVALLITVGASIPLLCLLGLMKGYAGIAIVSCLFALFYPCVQPLGDSLILQSLQESPIPYGRVRLAGSVSYALCSLAAGALLGRNYRAMPWMAAGILALLFGGALLLPPQAGRPHTRIRGGFWQVFRLPHALPLLGLVMLLQAAMGYFYSYFALHFTSLNGGSGALLGWAYLIGSASEIPFLLLGIVMGVCDLIPYVGPYLGGIPIVLFSLPQGLYTVLWAVVAVVAVQQAESMFLSPQLMSGVTGLHPAYVLLLLSAGGLLGGIAGMLLSLPLYVCARGAVRALQCAARENAP